MTGVDEESNGTDPEACPPSLSEVYKKVARYICRTADPAGISLGARIKPLANVTKSDLQQHPGWRRQENDMNERNAVAH